MVGLQGDNVWELLHVHPYYIAHSYPHTFPQQPLSPSDSLIPCPEKEKEQQQQQLSHYSAFAIFSESNQLVVHAKFKFQPSYSFMPYVIIVLVGWLSLWAAQEILVLP